MKKISDSAIILCVFGTLTLILAALLLRYNSELAARDAQAVSLAGSLAGRNIEFTTDFYGLRYSGVSSNLIDVQILYYGAFEKPLLYWLRDTTKLLNDDRLVFVDVGANTGQHTMFMAPLVGEVHSFEPYPPVIEKLRSTVERNALTNVSIHPVGLGAGNDVLEFFEPPDDNQGTGSFVHPFQNRSPGVTQLQIVAGDDYFAKRGIDRVDLVKIDVEGYEKAVLAGLANTIRRQRPIIIMELTVTAGEEQLFQSHDELTAAFPEGYEFALLPGPTGQESWTGAYELTPMTNSNPSFAGDGQSTVIAYPAEKASLVSRFGGAEN